MLRSLPKDFNLIHFIYRENRIDSKSRSIKGRNLRVMYRYSLPHGCVTGIIEGTIPHQNLVCVRFDNGEMIRRRPESFDLIDRTGKVSDYIIEYYK